MARHQFGANATIAAEAVVSAGASYVAVTYFYTPAGWGAAIVAGYFLLKTAADFAALGDVGDAAKKATDEYCECDTARKERW